MSSELVVFGFIELASDSAETGDFVSDDSFGLKPRIRSAMDQGNGPFVAFATARKKTDSGHSEALQAEFESILRSVPFFSAHLSVKDEEGVGDRHLFYVRGLLHLEGPEVVTRTVINQKSGNTELLDW